MNRLRGTILFLLAVAALVAGGYLTGLGTAADQPVTVPKPAEITTPQAAEKPAAKTTVPQRWKRRHPGDTSWAVPLPGDKTRKSRLVMVKNPLYTDKEPELYDTGSVADNDACLVCHANFEDELFAATHLSSRLPCASCHGDSEAHRADEHNIVRPDVLWGRAQQEPFCMQCHPKHLHPEKVEAFHKEWDGKRRANGRWVSHESVCMDCHGKHALPSKQGGFK